VAMATAKLHALLQTRTSQDLKEISYLIYSLNQALQNAIEVGNADQYSFLIPVMKALLEKTRLSVSLTTNAPDMPSTSSGPEFFHEFQMYCTSKQWIGFIEKKVSGDFFLFGCFKSKISFFICYSNYLCLLDTRWQ
jgi:neurobeachin-like protein 1/2